MRLNAGLGIDPHRCDPLPVAVVVCLVAVDQQSHEPALAPAPVDPEILGQERARRRGGPDCASIPRGGAGASRRRRADIRSVPGSRPRRLVRHGSSGSSRGSGPETPSARCGESDGARDGRSRASRAVVEMRRLPHRAAGAARPRAERGSPVCRYGERREVLSSPSESRVRPVSPYVGREEATQPLATRALAARQGLGDLLLEPELRQPGETSAAQPRGKRRQLARRANRLSAPGVKPSAMERREDRVGVALLGAKCGDVIDGGQARVRGELDSPFPTRLG